MGYYYDVICPRCRNEFETKKKDGIQCRACGKKFDIPDDFCLCCTYSLTGKHCEKCHKKNAWQIKELKKDG